MKYCEILIMSESNESMMHKLNALIKVLSSQKRTGVIDVSDNVHKMHLYNCLAWMHVHANRVHDMYLCVYAL